jgi:hypothetical protein
MIQSFHPFINTFQMLALNYLHPFEGHNRKRRVCITIADEAVIRQRSKTPGTI